MAWIKDPQKKKRVLQLHGPASAGKSVISQTIAEICQEYGLLIASFFFSCNLQDRNTGKRLFITLAYQLALNTPALKDKIKKVIKSDPAIITKSMEVQLKKLILQPLAEIDFTPESALQCVIIIDGLDECLPGKQQLDILLLIFYVLEQPSFPFCFIIASRSEPRIVDHLNSPQYHDESWSINLNSGRDAEEDIHIVLRSGFAKIHDNPIHAHSMTSILKPWPTELAIETIVARSSGQFAYAMMALKFIDNPDYEPIQQLQIILDTTHPHHSNAFPNLDELYYGILKQCRNPEHLVDVLGYLIVLIQGMNAYAATWGCPLGMTGLLTILDQLLSWNPGNSFGSLRSLHSLISVFTPTGAGSEASGIKFHHASFVDFLTSEQHAGPFFIKVSAVHSRIACSCLRILHDFPLKNVTPDGYRMSLPEFNLFLTNSSYLFPPLVVWVYAILFWCYHCSNSKYETDLGKELHVFNVCKDWVLIQTSSSPRVIKVKLREALITLDVQELDGCPGQSRWFSGEPDMQSMTRELRSVINWLEQQVCNTITAL